MFMLVIFIQTPIAMLIIPTFYALSTFDLPPICSSFNLIPISTSLFLIHPTILFGGIYAEITRALCPINMGV